MVMGMISVSAETWTCVRYYVATLELILAFCFFRCPLVGGVGTVSSLPGGGRSPGSPRDLC